MPSPGSSPTPDRTRQFLVADEVGLGKTMVARGVIARTIELLQGSVHADRHRLHLLERRHRRSRTSTG